MRQTHPDPQIALGYSKNLLEQGQVGAAIFVLEAQVSAAPSEELRDPLCESCWRRIV